MGIVYHESSGTFHLYNDAISYIMIILKNGHLGQLYYGKRIRDREDFSYLLETSQRPMTARVFEDDDSFSLEHIRQEYPVFGTTDFRQPAVEVCQENGSRLSDFQYQSYRTEAGKPKLPGLPATYTEEDDEAETLTITLKDPLTGIRVELLYTIFSKGGVLTRSAGFVNEGRETVRLTRAMSLCLDLPDRDYVWQQLSGCWARECHVHSRKLEPGIQAIGSMRGNSSHEHNPFLVLRRPHADERQGEVIGLSLIYSGNFRIQAEVDALLEQGAESLLIDLRGDPGGYVSELEQILDYLLPEGPVFTHKPRWWFKSVYVSDENCVDLPMAVLVNQHSYSAAELLAAQLRESAGAPIVGELTSGKGYSQITFPLINGGGVGLSTAAYCTGSGHSLIGEGLIPDVELSLPEGAVLGGADDVQLQAAVELLTRSAG